MPYRPPRTTSLLPRRLREVGFRACRLFPRRAPKPRAAAARRSHGVRRTGAAREGPRGLRLGGTAAFVFEDQWIVRMFGSPASGATEDSVATHLAAVGAEWPRAHDRSRVRMGRSGRAIVPDEAVFVFPMGGRIVRRLKLRRCEQSANSCFGNNWSPQRPDGKWANAVSSRNRLVVGLGRGSVWSAPVRVCLSCAIRPVDVHFRLWWPMPLIWMGLSATAPRASSRYASSPVYGP
jgi:hypothetical protein